MEILLAQLLKPYALDQSFNLSRVGRELLVAIRLQGHRAILSQGKNDGLAVTQQQSQTQILLPRTPLSRKNTMCSRDLLSPATFTNCFRPDLYNNIPAPGNNYLDASRT